jgi:hypothetical protein
MHWCQGKVHPSELPSMLTSSKMPSFKYFIYLHEQKKSHWGLDLVNREGVPALICLLAKSSLTGSALIQAPTILWWHTETHSDNNRHHLERDWYRSKTTQLWNADMPTSSNHTEVSVHCCHSKHMVVSSRTLLSDLIYYTSFSFRHSAAVNTSDSLWCHVIICCSSVAD